MPVAATTAHRGACWYHCRRSLYTLRKLQTAPILIQSIGRVVLVVVVVELWLLLLLFLLLLLVFLVLFSHLTLRHNLTRAHRPGSKHSGGRIT